jgi:Domain of unknown function (DUF2017)
MSTACGPPCSRTTEVALLRKRRVERTGPDDFALRLHTNERDTVGHLLPQLRELLQNADPSDPRLKRLYPTAYASDPESDAEYQRLMRDDLTSSRLTSIDAVLAGLKATRLTEGELVGWMQGINSARLVLGTMLDVSENDDRQNIDEEDPDFGAVMLFDYLGGLLDDIVNALS